MSNTYEPHRQFRWILEIDGIESFLMSKVTFRRESMSSPVEAELLYTANRDCDFSVNPLPSNRTKGYDGILKFLNEDGTVLDQYQIYWAKSMFTPFASGLDYTSSEPILNSLRLSDVTLRRVALDADV